MADKERKKHTYAEVTARAEPSQCPRCGSTQRKRYTSKVAIESAGTHDGKSHTHIVKRRTQCANCGLFRFDQSFENNVNGSVFREDIDDVETT